MKETANANRDLFRYVSSPIDMVKVLCPVREDALSERIVDAALPMLDPHELLEWLWTTGRIKVPKKDIEKLRLD